MKKLLSTLAVAVTFVNVASADFARVEMGVGAWMQTPSGKIGYSYTTPPVLGVSTTTTIDDVSNGNAQTGGYVWALVKHPIPVVPNLRLEYVSAVSEGNYVGSIKTSAGASVPATSTSIPTGSSTSTLEMTQIDVIPYYNILDNTFWVTVDLGLDVKIIELNYTSQGVDVIEAVGVDMAGLVLPLGYVRARVQAPMMNFGFEADVKYISYDGNTISDVRAKVDYTFDFIPVIQPAIEVGYRIQSFDVSDSGFSIKNDYAGVYAGMMLRF